MRTWLPVLLLTCCTPLLVQAQDVVIAHSKSGARQVKRKGTIVDWTGDALVLSSKGKERRIENERIIQVQTEWDEHYTEGRKALEQFQFDEAIVSLTRPFNRKNDPGPFSSFAPGCWKPTAETKTTSPQSNSSSRSHKPTPKPDFST